MILCDMDQPHKDMEPTQKTWHRFTKRASSIHADFVCPNSNCSEVFRNFRGQSYYGFSLGITKHENELLKLIGR